MPIKQPIFNSCVFSNDNKEKKKKKRKKKLLSLKDNHLKFIIRQHINGKFDTKREALEISEKQ